MVSFPVSNRFTHLFLIAFLSSAEQPRASHRVPPGGKTSIVFNDEFTPAPAVAVKPRLRAVDHIVFSEADSIPHSIYASPSKHHQVSDTCGKLINDMDHCPMPVSRNERRQVPAGNASSMGNILNHEVQQVIPRRGRTPLGGQQTFTLA
jgi:hypothetical protein